MKEYRPLSDIKSMWIAVLLELKNDHQSKEFVLILIKIYNNRSKLLALAVVVPLMINKYPDLVKSILENENPSSKLFKISWRMPEYPIPGCHICFGFFNPENKAIYAPNYLENATSIHLAALYGLTGVVEKLSKKYDDPIIKDSREANAIHYAALNGHLNIVKHLIGFTDTPLAPTRYGMTPIHYAVINGNLETVKVLVGLTKTPNTPDDYGRTPIRLARDMKNMIKINKYIEVQKFLEDYSK